MAELNSKQATLTGNAPQLARLLGATEPDAGCWLPEDLPDLLRCQWDAAIDFDLAHTPSENRRKTLAGAAQLRIRTFGDLLRHPTPSLAILKLAKEFFKTKAGGVRNQRPECDIAYLFYMLVILVARNRLGEKISRLTDSELERGIKWSLRQTWVQGEARELMIGFSTAAAGK
jgi:hypothetical protein